MRDTFDKYLNEAYQGTLKRKPDGSKFVLACKNSDQIEIYNAKNEEIECYVNGPLFKKAMFEVAGSAKSKGMALDRTKSIEGYSSVATTDKYIIGLFGGGIVADTKYGSATTLHIIDWLGKPVARYSLNQKLMSIDIDRETNTLYGLSINPIREVFSCKLDLS